MHYCPHGQFGAAIIDYKFVYETVEAWDVYTSRRPWSEEDEEEQQAADPDVTTCEPTVEGAGTVQVARGTTVTRLFPTEDMSSINEIIISPYGTSTAEVTVTVSSFNPSCDGDCNDDGSGQSGDLELKYTSPASSPLGLVAVRGVFYANCLGGEIQRDLGYVNVTQMNDPATG